MKAKVITLLLISAVITLSFTFASRKHIQKSNVVTQVNTSESIGGLASGDPIK